MIHIEKGPEPEAFRQWKEQNPEATYGEMPREVGLALRNALLEEQGFVCCFCGCAIGPFDDKGEIDQIPLESIRPHNIRNAHIVPSRRTLPKRSIMAISVRPAIPAGTRKTTSIATRRKGTESFLSLPCRRTASPTSPSAPMAKSSQIQSSRKRSRKRPLQPSPYCGSTQAH